MQWQDKTQQISLAELRAAANAARARAATLTVLSGSAAGHTERLSGDWLVVGRGEQANLRIDDEGISRQHCRIRLQAEKEVVVEDLGSTNGTYVDDRRVTQHLLQEGDKLRIGGGTILGLRFVDALDEAFSRRQLEQATRDNLTGCLNKNAFLERLPAELAHARRHRQPISVVVADLDHFKQINDGYGHLVGDQVLAAVGRSLAASLRQSDLLARFGGEEFVILLREASAAGAAAVAEKLRTKVADIVITVPSGLLSVTASFGVASWPGAGVDEPEALLPAADRALYAAKKAGRNRVASAQPASPQ